MELQIFYRNKKMKKAEAGNVLQDICALTVIRQMGGVLFRMSVEEEPELTAAVNLSPALEDGQRRYHYELHFPWKSLYDIEGQIYGSKKIFFINKNIQRLDLAVLRSNIIFLWKVMAENNLDTSMELDQPTRQWIGKYLGLNDVSFLKDIILL